MPGLLVSFNSEAERISFGLGWVFEVVDEGTCSVKLTCQVSDKLASRHRGLSTENRFIVLKSCRRKVGDQSVSQSGFGSSYKASPRMIGERLLGGIDSTAQIMWGTLLRRRVLHHELGGNRSYY